jgi:hypothetical protein
VGNFVIFSDNNKYRKKGMSKKNLDYLTEEDMKKAIGSKYCTPEDFLVLAKMLCPKKGMPYKEWEEIFHEQEERQRLRKFGISEHLITDIISYTIRPIFEDRNIKEIGSFI